MKRSFALLALVMCASLAGTVQAADKPKARKQTCCEIAIAAGKECRHKCCVTAHRAGKSCEKCNPDKEDIAAKKAAEKAKKAGKKK